MTMGSKEQPSMTEAPILTPDATRPADLRAEFETMVLRDLLGPAGGETEEIEERHVTERYLVGLVAPKTPFRRASAKKRWPSPVTTAAKRAKWMSISIIHQVS